MTLVILGTARSRAFRTLWMAEELGIPYRHEPVGFDEQGIGSAAFKAINPMGQIPAIDDGGVVLSESMAINLYLADRHGGPIAARDVAERGKMTMWSFFSATALESPALQVLYNRVTKPEAERDEKAALAGLAALERPLGVLNGALAGGHLVGGRFTVADLNVACAVFYLRFETALLASHGNLARWYAAIKARPAFVKAMALRGE